MRALIINDLQSGYKFSHNISTTFSLVGRLGGNEVKKREIQLM
jgi:hypothetical protein